MLCIHRFETVGSTNDEAIRLAREGAPAGSVVWALEQTAGRGRMGRAWESTGGNLHMTVLVRPGMSQSLAGRISVAVGLALAEALRRETWQPVRTKWPNDLYLYGRKVGGVLVETASQPGGALDWAVVGVGVNVAGHPNVQPPGRPATSLSAHGSAGSLEVLVPALARAVVDACAEASTDAGWAALAARWSRLDLAAGDILVYEDGEEWEGAGQALEDNGALLVRAGDELRTITAGEVSIRAREAGI